MENKRKRLGFGCSTVFGLGLAAFPILLYFFIINYGMYICDLPGENAALRMVGAYGNRNATWRMARFISEKKPWYDCCSAETNPTLARLCDRFPEEKEKVIDYIVSEILEEDKPQ